MIDLDRGWPTERLDLEPLAVAHAAELAPLLDDAALHEFTGGTPLSAVALAARYALLAARRSPDGEQFWGNWVIRVRATCAAVGTVQATLPAGGPAAGPAEVAWVVVRAAQGRGYAREAARSLVVVLREAGWTVVAYIHPRRVLRRRAQVGSMPGAREGADLKRDPRFALHGPAFHPQQGQEAGWPGEAKIAGRVVPAGPAGQGPAGELSRLTFPRLSSPG